MRHLDAGDEVRKTADEAVSSFLSAITKLSGYALVPSCRQDASGLRPLIGRAPAARCHWKLVRHSYILFLCPEPRLRSPVAF